MSVAPVNLEKYPLDGRVEIIESKTILFSLKKSNVRKEHILNILKLNQF